MAFAPTIPVPSALPPSLAGAALLADRVEGLLTRFCDSHPDEEPELLIRASRAIWNLTAVRKTIYLLTNPGADRRHRRGKPDATMTYIEHRVSELHDWVAEYQRLVRAMKKDPTQFTVTPTPSGTYNIQHIENVPDCNASPNPQPTTQNPQPDSSDFSSQCVETPSGGSSSDSSSSAPPRLCVDNSSAPAVSPSAPLRLCVENSSTPAASPSASSASLRFNSPDFSTLPNHMTSTPPLRNPLGTALAAARETVAIAHEANVPFDRTNFFPTEIDPAAAIADAHDYQCKSNQSQNPCPPPSSPNSSPPEKITFRNRQVTLTGKPMPPNDLPQLPKLPKLAAPPNPRKSSQSQNPRPLPNPLPNPKSAVPCPLSPVPSPPQVPSRSDFFALINKITKQPPPSSPPPPPSIFDTPGTLSDSILHNLKPGLRLPTPHPSPSRRRLPT